MTNRGVLLLVGLLCVAVRVADADECDGEEDNMLCPERHRDGDPDGQCYGDDCCITFHDYDGDARCEDDDYEVIVKEEGYTWPVGPWTAYGCCKEEAPWGAIIGGSVGGLVLIAIIVAVSCYCYKNNAHAAAPPRPESQGLQMPGQPIAGQPTWPAQAYVQPIAQPQLPFGTKFNTETGETIPKFDPETGKQNW